MHGSWQRGVVGALAVWLTLGPPYMICAYRRAQEHLRNPPRVPGACGDYIEDREVPGYCWGCTRPREEHKEYEEIDI